jgi:hypothetical protein
MNQTDDPESSSSDFVVAQGTNRPGHFCSLGVARATTRNAKSVFFASHRMMRSRSTSAYAQEIKKGL